MRINRENVIVEGVLLCTLFRYFIVSNIQVFTGHNKRVDGFPDSNTVQSINGSVFTTHTRKITLDFWKF